MNSSASEREQKDRGVGLVASSLIVIMDEVYRQAIEVLEQALIEEYENDRAIGLMLGRMGANIMGMLEDGGDLG